MKTNSRAIVAAVVLVVLMLFFAVAAGYEAAGAANGTLVPPRNSGAAQQLGAYVPVDPAFTDMYAHAARHFDRFVERPETFGRTPNWSAEYDLHWVDFEVGGKLVRVYHATDKRDRRMRFTWSWDPSAARWTDWERTQ